MRTAIIIVLVAAVAVIAFIGPTITGLVNLHNTIYRNIGLQDQQFELQIKGVASPTPNASVELFASPSSTPLVVPVQE